MSTITLLALLAGAGLGGAFIGFYAAVVLHRPHEIARLTAANTGLAHEVEEWRAKCWRAEHVAAFFIGLRNCGSIIAVDLRIDS